MMDIEAPHMPPSESYEQRAAKLKRELAQHVVGAQAWSEVVDQIVRLEEKARQRRAIEARIRAAGGGDRRRA
jgi:hypothetical protein